MRILVLALVAMLTTSGAVWGVETLRVQAFRSGELTINGKPGTLAQLQKKLAHIKAVHGVVWFYRDDPSEDPTDRQFEIFKSITDAKVAISFSTKPDFSDYVDATTGQSRPRSSLK
jgi:hypothetical protein